MMRFVIALVLMAHGIGHSIGIMQSLRIATINPDWNGDSWLISGFAGTSVTQAVGVVVWTVALVGFLLAAAVVVGGGCPRRGGRHSPSDQASCRSLACCCFRPLSP